METSSVYTENDGARYHAKRIIPPNSLERIYKTRAAKFQPYAHPGQTIFEYGCGSGWNLARLKTGRRIGYDVSPMLKDEVEALGIEWCEDTSTIPDATAEVVICHHALEHVLDPRAALLEMWRIIKPEGALILNVPYETGRKTLSYDPLDKDHHLFSWTPQTLGALVEECNFHVGKVELRPFGYDRAVAVATDKRSERAYRSLLWAAQRFGGRREIFLRAFPLGKGGLEGKIEVFIPTDSKLAGTV